MKKLIILFTLSLLLGSCSNLPANEISIKPAPVVNAMETDNPKEKTIPIDVSLEKPIVTSVQLVAIGDILIHQPVYWDAATPQGGYNFSSMFTKVKPFIEEADIAVANQETMIGGAELGLSGYPLFNSPYEIGDALKEAGIDLVTLANNHTLDQGEKGIRNALAYWDRIGMAYTGAFKSNADRENIRTVNKNGIGFSFLSYSYGTNGLPVPEDKEYLINLINLSLIKQDVEKAKALSDVVVVSMHWGNEYEKEPNQMQLDLAKELSNMGVDIIIGHHPHVLQPMDWIERVDGSRTFVMYSLGNFLSAQDGLEKMTGGIGGIEITKTTSSGKSVISLSNPSFIPTYAYNKNKRNFSIIPMVQLNDSYLSNYLSYYESTQNHMMTLIKE
ncbi:CapA family protein [Paenisporosarcina sp. OV554]|uniref:CapA family protein n=1 Tax=Paenisporosarcina sp. OV554 TaxID=2135694 RepID=UPI000D388C1F|nr:CapA family protein [Paenisporosarcina sp. OV554]PUB09560.1 poly-gamma-glutamate synthesis protein (capsule biosynthesis protein) [Paenisporosarcina sp. OV554]